MEEQRLTARWAGGRGVVIVGNLPVVALAQFRSDQRRKINKINWEDAA